MKKLFPLVLACAACWAVQGQMPLPCFDIWDEATLTNFVGEIETRCVRIDAGATNVYVADDNSRSFLVDEGKLEPSDNLAIFPGPNQGGFKMIARGGSETQLEGVWYEPADSYEVPLYDKVEWGIALPSEVATAIQNWISNDQSGSNFTPALNPFNPEEIDVWAEIMGPGQTSPQIIYGFYYRPYDRIWSGNNPNNLPDMYDPDNWFRQELPTAHPFRFRFSPVSEGLHFVQLHLTLADGTTYDSVSFPFGTLPTNADKGFIGLTPNKRYFDKPNGDVFFPVGPELFPASCECNRKFQSSNEYPLNWLGQPEVNLEVNCEECYWNGMDNYCCGLDEFVRDDGVSIPYDWRYTYWRQYNDNVEQYTEHIAAYLETLKYIEVASSRGANAFRTILTPLSYDFEFEKLNNYYDRQFMAWEFDELIEKAHEQNMRIELTLLLHNQFTKEHSENFDWTDESSSSESTTLGNCYYTERDLTNCDTEPISFMREEASKMFYKRKLRYFIARYGYSKDIYLLELMSEANNIGKREPGWSNWMTSNQQPNLSYGTSADSRFIVAQWHNEMADYIKNHLHHNRHLIAADYTGIPYKNDPVAPLLGRASSDYSWASAIIDVHAYSSYANTLNRWQMWSDLNADSDWRDLQFGTYNSIDNSHPFLLAALPFQSINKPMVHPESGPNDVFSEIENSSLIRDLWAHGFSGFATSGGYWWDRTPSENWDHYNNVIQFMQSHLFNEISVSTTNEWTCAYENDEDKKVEVVYMYRSGDDPKAVGVIFNINYNPSNMCHPEDWPFLTNADLDKVENRNKYYNNTDEEGFHNEFQEDYYLDGNGESFTVDLDNVDSPFLDNLGWCDEFEIKYYHPWNQSELSTEHDNTSTINDRLRLKSIPTLTEAMPFVLFTAHRTGACVEGWFGMEALEVEPADTIQFRSNHELNAISIITADDTQAGTCFIAPNPTNGLVHINTSEQIVSVRVFDSRGNLIDGQMQSAAVYDFNHLSSGTYFLQVETTQSQFTFKILKL